MNEKVTKAETRELTEAEIEKVVGGHTPLYNDGYPYEPYKTEKESQGDGGATGGW